MKSLMSALLAAALAATQFAPALAGPKDHGGQAAGRSAAAPTAAQPQQPRGGGRHAQQAAPQAAPQRVMRQERAAPARAIPQAQMIRPQRQRFDNAPARVAPQRMVRQFDNRPARIESRPMRIESRPVRIESRPARIQNRPVQFENRPARFENRPVRFENRRVEAPFVQRVRGARADNQAPFEQVVRPQRAHFEARNQAFVAGRVVNEDNDDLFLENAAGQTIVVRGWHGRHKHWHWANRDVTVPVVFENGAYYAVGMPVEPATVTSFFVPSSNLLMPAATYVPNYVADYSYVPAYAYAPAYSYTPDYTNYAVASTISTLVSNVLGSNHSSLGNSLLTNYLASYALSSLSGYSPPGQSYAYPAAYASPLTYSYPTTCVYNDPNTGNSYYDPSCAPAATTTYYTSASAYTPAQVQGVVVGSSGSTLMVLGSNGMNPVLVNDAPALQSGLAFSGQPAVGRLITAYGFYDGNTFVATALQ